MTIEIRKALAGIAVLNGGRAVEIRTSDRQQLYDQLGGQLREAGLEVPALRSRWDEPYSRREVRTLPTELRVMDEDGAPLIAGRAVPYGALSEGLGFGREVIERRAFAKSLQEKPEIHALYHHEPGTPPLGSTHSGTLALEDRDDGLHFRLKPPASAVREIEAVQRGDVRHTSFGFRAIKDSWEEESEDGQPLRHVHEAELFEISLTPFPAYRQTSAALRSLESWAVKGLTDEEIEVMVGGVMGDPTIQSFVATRLIRAADLEL